MKPITVAEPLASLAESLTVAVDVKIQERVARGEDIINLGVGQPDFSTPASIREAAARAVDSFTALADLHATVVDGPHAEALINLAYEQHLPLKRWMWRAGLLAAAEGRAVDEITWPQTPEPHAALV